MRRRRSIPEIAGYLLGLAIVAGAAVLVLSVLTALVLLVWRAALWS